MIFDEVMLLKRIVETYGIEGLTNIKVHIKDSMPKILVKELVIQSHVMTNLLPD